MVDKLAVALEFIGYFRSSWPDNLDDPLQLSEEDCYYQCIVRPSTHRSPFLKPPLNRICFIVGLWAADI